MITSKDFDFTTKELVKTLSYCSCKNNREAYADVIVNGRKYIKLGTLQAVTVVCDVYKIFNNTTNMVEYWACFGMAKQHPNDLQVNKDLAYETAHLNAQLNPFCILQVNKRFGQNIFLDIIRPYINDMDLEFVKTKEEIKCGKPFDAN